MQQVNRPMRDSDVVKFRYWYYTGGGEYKHVKRTLGNIPRNFGSRPSYLSHRARRCSRQLVTRGLHAEHHARICCRVCEHHPTLSPTNIVLHLLESVTPLVSSQVWDDVLGHDNRLVRAAGWLPAYGRPRLLRYPSERGGRSG